MSPSFLTDSSNGSPVTDSRTVELQARERLGASPYAQLRKVRCHVRDGMLFLTGELSSYHMKQMAQAAVRSVEGVTVVVNLIEVE